jgi:hypothetical protein
LQNQLVERLGQLGVTFFMLGKACEIDDFFFIQVVQLKVPDAPSSLLCFRRVIYAKDIMGCGVRPLCSTDLV